MDGTAVKTCGRCKAVKSTEDFTRDSSTANGLVLFCGSENGGLSNPHEPKEMSDRDMSVAQSAMSFMRHRGRYRFPFSRGSLVEVTFIGAMTTW